MPSKLTSGIRPIHIMMATQFFTGLLMMMYPSEGIMAYFETVTHLPAVWFGLHTVTCSLLLLSRPSLGLYIALTFPMMVYIVAGAMFVFATNSLSPAFLSTHIGFYMIMLWLYANGDLYERRK